MECVSGLGDLNCTGGDDTLMLRTGAKLVLSKYYLAQHVVSHKETVKPIWLVSLIFLRFYLIVLK